MSIDFKCPHCTTLIESEAASGGRQSSCPACGEPVQIPFAELKPGSELGGFRLLGKLGSGAMGQVYEAEQMSLGRRVALKVLSPKLTHNAMYLERFHHEVRVLAKLEHPHIVQAYGAGEEDGYHYLAMQFVDGEDLETIVDKQGPLDEVGALSLALQVASALRVAWRQHGILHRDIKPANLMIDREGDVFIMDLGISKSVQHDSKLTLAGMIVGTPYFMSPEQATDGELDCRSDMYSLGATLYFLLSGKLPHEGEGTMEILSKVVLEAPYPLVVLRPDLSMSTCKLVERLMARDCQDRFPTWEALIHELRELLDTVPEPVAVTAGAGKKVAVSLLLALITGVAALALTRRSAPVESPAMLPAQPQPVVVAPAASPSDESADMEGIASMYQYAMEFSLSQPTRSDEAIRKFEQVREEGAGTPYEAKASLMIEQLQALAPEPEAPEEAAPPRELRKRMRELILDDRFEEARAMIDQEKEHLSPLQYRRIHGFLSNHLRNHPGKEGRGANQAAKQEDNAASHLSDETQNVAELLIGGEYKAARETVAQLQKKPELALVTSDVQALYTLTELATQWPTIMLASYNSASGQRRSVHLKSGVKTLIIERMTATTLYAKEEITNEHGTGRFSRVIPLAELTLDERLGSLGTGETPMDFLRRGLLCQQAGASARARGYFAQADCPLGQALASSLP